MVVTSKASPSITLWRARTRNLASSSSLALLDAGCWHPLPHFLLITNLFQCIWGRLLSGDKRTISIIFSVVRTIACSETMADPVFVFSPVGTNLSCRAPGIQSLHRGTRKNVHWAFSTSCHPVSLVSIKTHFLQSTNIVSSPDAAWSLYCRSCDESEYEEEAGCLLSPLSAIQAVYWLWGVKTQQDQSPSLVKIDLIRAEMID